MKYIQQILKNNITQALFITATVMFVFLIGFPSFFHIDDANNSYLPNLMQQGRSWLNGEVPIIINKTLIGDNMLVDIDRAIFLPTNIVASIFTALVKNMNLTSYFLVFVNLFIISFASLWAAKQLSNNNSLSFIAAASITINPIVVYIYAASWYNGLSGHAWFLMSVASTIYFIRTDTVRSVLINCLSVVFLFLSGWPHAIIAYAVFLIIYVGFMPGLALKQKILYAMILLGCVFIVTPAFSEYVANGGYLDRPGGVNNFGNFLSPSWDQILMGFNPFYNSYINTFGGYRYWPIAIGFIGIIPGIIIWNAFVNKKIPSAAYPFLILAGIFFILTQLPQQLGPTRWQFRYLPFFSYFLIFAASIIGSTGWSVSKKFINIITTVILLTAILSWLKGDLPDRRVYFLLVISTTLIMYVLTYKKLWQNPICIVLISLILPLLIFKNNCTTLANGYLASNTIKNRIDVPNLSGRILVATGVHGYADSYEKTSSANLQWYNISSVNGYSPVGNKAIIDIFHYYTAHAIFDTEMLVNNLSNDFDGRYQCILNKLDVSLFIINKGNDNLQLQNKLASCGYVRTENKGFIHYENDALTGAGVNSERGSRVSVIDRGNNLDKYKIYEGGRYYFSRVGWKGYSVYMNGKQIPFQIYAGFIPYVDVNKGGILEIRYEPSSWKYTVPIFLLGVLLIVATTVLSRKVSYIPKNNL